MKDLIRKILKEDFNREPVHGHSIPNGWVDGNTREFFEANGVKYVLSIELFSHGTIHEMVV
jgi:hypothetical protein